MDRRRPPRAPDLHVLPYEKPKARARRAMPTPDEFYGTTDVEHESPPPRSKPKTRVARKPQVEVRVVGSVDYALLFTVSILVLIGVVMVFSASYMMASSRVLFNNDPFWFLRNNIYFAAAGFLVMLALANVSYEIIRPFSPFIYGLGVFLLVLVITIGIATSGAQRWLELPIIGQFQPSEVARAALIFLIAYIIEKFPGMSRNIKGLLFLAITVALVAGLIAYPGGFTVALITMSIGFAMIAVASPFFWRFAALGGVGAIFVAAFLWWQSITDGGFRGTRFNAWLDPFSDPLGSGFQIIQSLYAIASGGWFGLGVGNSQQASFIPEPQNDIIFAIIVEELGFFGATAIIALFGLFIWRGIIISMRAPDTYSSMVALGIVFAIGFQAIINIAVVTNTIPNTGVNLPFISYGGTSLLVSMAMVGVLLNISRYTVQKK